MPQPPTFADLSERVLRAHDRLRPYIRVTPFDESLALRERLGVEVWLKLENLQHTGSFKARGALHKVLCLTPAERERGVIAASSGNHGAALAWACRTSGVRARIFVPETASATKVAMIRRYGADVTLFGSDGLDTELHAREVAEREGMAYASPYNDIDVMCGQGTVAVEMAEQGPPLDAVYVAVGGGGLIGGIAAWLERVMPHAAIIGALPANSPVMAESVRAGHVVERVSYPTLSDGTAGGIEPGSITFPVCQALVTEWVTVSEAEIAESMRSFIETHHMLIEGSAGVALAAMERNSARHAGERVGIVLCGANVSLTTLGTIVQM